MKEIMRQSLRKAVHTIEMPFDVTKRQIKSRFNLYEPIRILPFRGFGNRKQQTILGRVLEDRELASASPEDAWWKNAGSMIQRFRTDEIAFCRLSGKLSNASRDVQTDSEGYFQINFDAEVTSRSNQIWHDVQMEVLDSVTDQEQVTATGKVLVPPEEAEFGVISDIDDTILKSSAFDFFQLVKLSLTQNAFTRTPVPGAAKFYQRLHRGTAGGGAKNPIFYVSSSAWNIYDLLERFIEFHGFPQGPLLLRDLGIDSSKLLKSGHNHKLEKIRDIMGYYPELPFVLIGDSGQRDAWLYREVAREFPGRVAAIYVHDVRESRRDDVHKIVRELKSEGVEMLLIQDAHAATRHAVAQRLIEEEAESVGLEMSPSQ